MNVLPLEANRQHVVGLEPAGESAGASWTTSLGESEAESWRRGPGVVERPPLRILVIEDSPSDTLLIQVELQRAFPGVACSFATSLEGGRRAIAQEFPDLILLDLLLPDSRGLQTIRQMRVLATEIPIVVLTGQVELQLAVESLRSGARDFLAKNELRNLEHTIERVLAEVHRERVNRERDSLLRRSLQLESLGRLAASVAHEINSPLQYIGDNLIFLRKAFELILPLVEHVQDPRARSALATQDSRLQFSLKQVPPAIHAALEGVSRVAQLVAAMQDHSPQDPEGRSPVDIPSVIKASLWRCRDQWLPIAKMVTEYGVSSNRLQGYPDALIDAFTDLIVSAAEALGKSPKSSTGIIHIQSSEDENSVEVRIHDNRTGISEPPLGALFPPFFTRNTCSEEVFHGLSMVHVIVEQKHGGQVRVESSSGQGVTVIISLPLL